MKQKFKKEEENKQQKLPLKRASPETKMLKKQHNDLKCAHANS